MTSMVRRPKIARPVRPNAGLTAAYQRKLDAAIEQMHSSLLWWLRATYRAAPPELAADASPAMAMRDAMNRLSRRWQRKFDQLAPRLARYFADATSARADASFRAALRDAGFTVRFKATAAQNDAFQAVIGEQVGLIKSIASQHLADVQGLVMRSVSQGRDLGSLAKALEEAYGVTKRRAAFISRDQNAKATAVFTRVRQEEIGVTKARWLHSAGGKVPRASHVAYSGKLYDVAKGAYIDGEWIRPGELINCRCVSVPVIPGLEDET